MKKINFKKIFLIFKNNYSINRSLPLILLLGMAILGSIVGAMPVSDLEMRYANRLEIGFATYEDYHLATKNLFDEMLGVDGVFSIMLFVAMFVLAFLSVISLSSFMRDKSGTDFYHSLSVNRKETYLAHYITAFLNASVTLILSQFLAIFFMSLISKYPTYSLGEMIVMQLPVLLTVLLYLALFIAIAMLSVIVSGTLFSNFLAYIFFNFFMAGTILCVSIAGGQLFSTNLVDYLSHKPYPYLYTSPFVRYFYGAEGSMPFTVWSYILLILGTVLVVLLGIFLYNLKKNENSQKPVAFSLFKRPLQYLIAFDAILLGATFFEAITNSPIWCFVGGVLALLFTFIFSNAFFDKTFTLVFKGSRHMLYIALATVVLGAIFVADIFGIYKEVKPDVTAIRSADLYITYDDGENNHFNYDFYFVDEENEYMQEEIILTPKIKKDLADFYSKILELRSERDKFYSSEREVIVYEDTKPTEKPLGYISISFNFSCEKDFSNYYCHLYAEEGEAWYDELKALTDSFISHYSHRLYHYDENGMYEENTVIIN